MTLAIAGGFYRERCNSVGWSEFYGSGGRSAACLQAFGARRQLYTFVCDHDRPTLQAIAESYNFEIIPTRSKQTISFEYFYPAALPIIRPPLQLVDAAKILEVEEENILRFGLLDGDAIVKGNMVVYDPQNAHRPASFAENGSTANKLAIVANLNEAARMAGVKSLEKIGPALLQREQAAAVVVKNGPWGAHVFTSDGKYERVPPYRTKRVFKIGSGDIFSAVFAFSWAVQRLDPVEAAKQASFATAFYCENMYLPLPPRSAVIPFPEVKVISDKSSSTRFTYDVYLASPFFNITQLWLVEEVRRLFTEHNLKVFSPLHDVGRGAASVVVKRDLQGIDKSCVVFACIDGLDSGTIYEVGYACAKGIPVIAFTENAKDEDLKMMEGSDDCTVVRDLTTAVYATVWRIIERRA
jgi:nucleoside 2-deoxyribosyltransferase